MKVEDQQQICQLLIRLGATSAQAEVMSRQILRRAEQIAVERGIERLQALDSLLRAVVSGRHGIVEPEDKDGAGWRGSK